MTGSHDAAWILEFWRRVELFGAGKVPRLREGHVQDVGRGEPLPWAQPEHPLRRAPARRDHVRQYVVYGSLFEQAAIVDAVCAAFGDVDPAAKRSLDECAVFAVTFDEDGEVVPRTATISACAWSVGRLRHPRAAQALGWLDGFEDDEQAFVDGLHRLSPPTPREDPDSVARRAGRAAARQLGAAARDAAAAGAKATGATAAAGVAVAAGAVAGPVVGGIAGAVSAAFVERLLTPPASSASDAAANESERERRHRPVTADDLHDLGEELAARLGVAGALRPRGLRVHAVQVRKGPGPVAARSELVNSFIAADLRTVRDAVIDGGHGQVLRTYLTGEEGIDRHARVDLREQRAALLAGVEPVRSPRGRWPGDPTRPLVLSQQFAVNAALHELARGGVFAVNGPPGTGKTTLLRDVVAAVVVERAERMAALATPADAFGAQLGTVRIDAYPALVTAVDERIAGSEIVLATNSNEAAANVTREIPGRAAVAGAEAVADSAGYFPELAEAIFGAGAWALVSAPLGNRANSRHFASTFWWGSKETGLRGMREILSAVRTAPGSSPSWHDAVTRFRSARAAVDILVAQRQEIAALPAQLHTLAQELALLDQAVRRGDEDRARATERVAAATRTRDGTAALEQEAATSAAEHASRQPNFWTNLATLFAAGRTWNARMHELDAELQERRDAAHAARTELEQRLSDRDNAHARTLAFGRDHERCQTEIAMLQRRLDQARAELGAALPSETADEAALQLSAPWSDPEISAARNTLTAAALALHRAFALNAGVALQHNLAVAIAMLENRTPRLDPMLALAAWRAFFLVVPVVSTTFASLPVLFGGLGADALGWFLVDEAGQATPQAVVGGAWRARRMLVVGDPQQLEPVISLAMPAQQALATASGGIDEQWLPGLVSAQRLADRHNTFGTALPDPANPIGGTTVWVGAPLRVHRRCDRTMFDVSNDIAYDGAMIFGTPDRPAFPGRDAWIDVTTGPCGTHWVPAEGVALQHLLRELTGQGIPASEICVLSPFREVASATGQLARRHPGGTIHTMQGKETDVVVLVLGAGSPVFVARAPNLVNVAVSRARRRIYVIGDRERWAGVRHVRRLAAAMQTRPYDT